MVKELYVSTKIYDLWKKTGVYLCDLEFNDGFSALTSTAQAIQFKNRSIGLHQN